MFARLRGAIKKKKKKSAVSRGWFADLTVLQHQKGDTTVTIKKIYIYIVQFQCTFFYTNIPLIVDDKMLFCKASLHVVHQGIVHLRLKLQLFTLRAFLCDPVGDVVISQLQKFFR